MNYLITGGTGLIGKALINSLHTKNNTITVLTRDKEKASSLLNKDINFIDELYLSDMENIDTVINLAGEPIAEKRWSKEQKFKICESRWNITEKLAHLISIAKKPPSLFISGSAIGIYGRQGNNPIDESFSRYHKEFTHEVCSRWEQIALEASSKHTRVAILRTGIVLDKKSGALSKMLLPFKLGVGGKVGKGDQYMSWIHLQDMISAILHIIDIDTLNGPINLTSPSAVTNETFSKALSTELRRPCLLSTPPPLLKLMFGEMADLLLFGQNIVPQKLVNSGFRFKHGELVQALKDLLK
ncbi:MAG: hypothetical protein ACI9YH_002708 [Colwellia sp.]|jgi:uncharacterized protein (TIGR01777 family)